MVETSDSLSNPTPEGYNLRRDHMISRKFHHATMPEPSCSCGPTVAGAQRDSSPAFSTRGSTPAKAPPHLSHSSLQRASRPDQTASHPFVSTPQPRLSIARIPLIVPRVPALTFAASLSQAYLSKSFSLLSFAPPDQTTKLHALRPTKPPATATRHPIEPCTVPRTPPATPTPSCISAVHFSESDRR